MSVFDETVLRSKKQLGVCARRQAGRHSSMRPAWSKRQEALVLCNEELESNIAQPRGSDQTDLRRVIPLTPAVIR